MNEHSEERIRHLTAGLTPEDMVKVMVDNGELNAELGQSIADLMIAEREKGSQG